MKVLQINKLYYPHIGGVEQVVRDISLELKDEVDMRVLAANTSPKTSFETIDGVKVVKIFSFGQLKSAPVAPTFGRWMKELKSDVYHFHVPNPFGELGYLLSKPPGKVVVTYHSDVIRQKIFLKFYQGLLLKFLGKVEVIMTTSPNMIENSPYLRPFREKCRPVPLGVSAEKFALTEAVLEKAAEIRKAYGRPLIFFLGRFIYYKGLEYLISAMGDIGATLILAGSGPLEENLRSQAAELGVSDKVIFVGQQEVSGLVAFFHACDLFVLPSVESSEAFGIVQVEAHICGKPVVSTNLPTGVPYVNLDGITGLVVPPRDSDALARAINRLLGDEELRSKMGEAARKRAINEFSRELMGQRVLNVYNEVLGLESHKLKGRSHL